MTDLILHASDVEQDMKLKISETFRKAADLLAGDGKAAGAVGLNPAECALM